MNKIHNLNKNILITGHYGSGKTCFAVNLALTLRNFHKNVVVVDLDTVNPYFRTADYKSIFDENDIELISPIFANTNLDIPALTANIEAVLQNKDKVVILDIGGDDAGAIALGRYNTILKEQGYDFLYLFNKYRYLTKTPNEATELLYEIEQASRLKATYLVNNSNLGEETTLSDLKETQEYANQLKDITKLPLLCTCVKSDLKNDDLDLFEIKTIF